MVKKTFKNLVSKAKERDSYWIGKAISDFTEDLCVLMESRNINKTELASRIDSSPAYVTKVLRGNTNFTIESMVRLVRAMDGQLCIRVARAEDHVRWFGLVEWRGAGFGTDRREEYKRVSESYVQRQNPQEEIADEIHPAAA